MLAGAIAFVHLTAAGVIFWCIRKGHEYEERFIHLILVALAGVVGILNAIFLGGGGEGH